MLFYCLVLLLSQEAFCSTCISGRWNSKVDLAEGEGVIIHSPTSIVHYPQQHFQPINHEVIISHDVVINHDVITNHKNNINNNNNNLFVNI